MLWRFVNLLLVVAFTAIVTMVLTGAHYGDPISDPVPTVIVPIVFGIGCFCRVAAWLASSNDK